jgi:hypothetical protein
MAALLPNVNRMVERDLLIMGVKHIEYIFDIVCTTNIFVPESDDIINVEMLRAIFFINN